MLFFLVTLLPSLFSFPCCHPHKSGGVQAMKFFTERSIRVREVDVSLFRDVNSNSDRWHPDSQMFPLYELLTPALTTTLTNRIRSSSFSSFQVFKTDVLVNGRLHSIEKRYSEFHALHKMVRLGISPDFVVIHHCLQLRKTSFIKALWLRL